MNNAKIFYAGIIFKCPLDKVKSDCPLREIRQMDGENRVNRYLKMNEDEFNRLIQAHHTCVNEFHY